MQQIGALHFALTRLLSAVLTLFFVVVLSFLMMRIAPGGPFDPVNRLLPPDTVELIEQAYRLDDPLFIQLGRYLGGLLQGDMGPSYFHRGYSVSELIADAAPVSMWLGAISIVIALGVGILAGVFAALRPNSVTDRVTTGLAMTGISIPVFIVAPLLILFFAVYNHWFPASWTGAEGASRLVLPVIALSLPQIAYIARLMRGSMIEVLSSDFVRTAYAQGLGTLTVIRRHALKPALLPLLSYMGPAVAGVLAGSVVIEQIFGIPGLGRTFVNAALNRNYTLVLGGVVFYATLVITLNLLVDVLYGFLDPRIRRR